VPPFDVRQRFIKEINGEKMGTYIDWMKSCYYITTIGFPAISVPCGFTADGLPVGVQIVGRHQDDLGVLQLAYAFEQATGFWKHPPPGGTKIKTLGDVRFSPGLHLGAPAYARVSAAPPPPCFAIKAKCVRLLTD
jgi:hypothetical protein